MKKVLIVDDEPEVLQLFQKFLGKHGYSVTTAGNALEALRVLNHDVSDIVLTDFRMPEMTGIDLLKEIRLQHPELPVILMSGQADMRVAVEALREHAFDFLSKPIDSTELLHCLEAASPEKRLVEDKHPGEGSQILGPLFFRHLENEPGVCVLSFNKSLDQYSQASYENAIRGLTDGHQLTDRIVLVLKGVPYINNIGLNFLLDLFDKWKTAGRKVVFTQPSEPVVKYLRLLGYINYFPMAGTLDEAIQAASKGDSPG